jgi:hypothetical protein
MRSVWLRLATVVIGLLFAILLSELFFIGYYYLQDSRYLSVPEKLQQEANVHLFQLGDTTECSYTETLAPHPYLAYIHHSNPPCSWKRVNKSGLYGPDFPLRKDPDHFVIMLTGGSVAVQFGNMTQGSLEEVLNQRYDIGNKKFVVLNGALEAWKQPQQLIMLLLHGRGIDGVVTLDGFNEVVFPFAQEYAERIGKPLKASYLAANPHLAPHRFLLAAWVNHKIYLLTRDAWMVRHSKLFYFLSDSIRGRVRAAVKKDAGKPRAQSLDSLFALPEEWSYTEKHAWNLDQYERYLLMMQAIAIQFKIKTAYFIQPVPAIAKNLTEDEQGVVGDLSYKDHYLVMEERLSSLRNTGVPVVSLTDLYANFDETVYSYAVHQKHNSQGYQLMAQRIADILEAEWGLVRRD